MMRICAGSVITNSWGDCDLSSSTTSCQAESLSLSSCSTPAGDCVFPFRHGGVVYQTCTTVDTGLSWCSTAVTDQGDHVPGTEGSCPASCDSTSTSTTAPTTSTSTSSTTSSTSTGCTPGQLSTVECNTCVCNSLGQQVTVYHQLLPSYHYHHHICIRSVLRTRAPLPPPPPALQPPRQHQQRPAAPRQHPPRRQQPAVV